MSRPILTRTLGHKSSGDDVRRVQRWLGLDATGYFTRKTERAVFRFQEQHGLVVDGLVGQATWAKMCAVFEPAPVPDPPDDPMPVSEPDPPPPPEPDPIAWGGIGIGAAFLLAMLGYWLV